MSDAPGLPDITVVVMAFNEERNLEGAMSEIHRTLVAIGRTFELLIIDDGSSDGTGLLADRLTANLSGARVIHHERNQGLGGVYRTGFAQARGSYVTFFPADGQFPPSIIRQFLPLVDQADMVLGTVARRDDSFSGRILSLGRKTVFRALFGTLPEFQSIIMFRRKLLDELPPLVSRGRGWTVLLELILRASRGGYRLMSVPTEIRPRASGVSKVSNLRTIWSVIEQAVALRCRMQGR